MKERLGIHRPDGGPDFQAAEESVEVTGHSISTKHDITFIPDDTPVHEEVAIISSYTFHSGGKAMKVSFPGFDTTKSNCIDGHELIEGRNIAEATRMALEEVVRRDFQEVQILTSDFHPCEIYPDLLDLMDFLTDRGLEHLQDSDEMQTNPVVRSFVGPCLTENFQEQLQGVKTFLRANPESELKISFRISHAEQAERFSQILAETI